MVTVRAPEATTRPVEQMRACYPHRSDYVERDGGRIAYEVYGAGDPPIVFVPPWQIVHSRVYKAQIPDFARRHLVLAWDHRGNGRSDRPTEPSVHTTLERASNLEAVMDASGVRAAVLVGLSSASGPMVVFADRHPDRVLALVFICPAAPLGQPGPGANVSFDDVLPDDVGWNKENVHFWRRDFRAYLEHFFEQALPERHSTKPREDAVGYGLDTDAETLAQTQWAPRTLDRDRVVAICAAVTVPTLVIQGTDDRITHVSQGAGLAAAIPGARLELVTGGGHLINTREPVRVNLLIRAFIATLDQGTSRARP